MGVVKCKMGKMDEGLGRKVFQFTYCDDLYEMSYPRINNTQKSITQLKYPGNNTNTYILGLL